MSEVSEADTAALRTSGLFDEQWYLEQYPDVKLLGMDPAEHYLWVGKALGRRASPFEISAISTSGAVPQAPGDRLFCDPQTYFMATAEQLSADDAYPVTNFMYYIWRSRLDLQKMFDLHDHQDRIEYCKWFLLHARPEYGMEPSVFPRPLLETLAQCDGIISETAREVINDSYKTNAANDYVCSTEEIGTGANLIGYARGEFGMGEHVRMVASSLNTTCTPFSIINVPGAGMHGENDDTVERWRGDHQRHWVNLFHINADILPSLYFRFGADFFLNRYNIGYWAWELAKCPAEFSVAFEMVDEVWGISGFVTESFRTLSPVPVFPMPLAVSLPPLKMSYTKSNFGLPEDDFMFLFTFDGASFLDRKNPIAAVRAFKLAFPKHNEKVCLVLKVMNVPDHDPHWDALVAEAREDQRIKIITARLKRDELLGLYAVCDAFVSLHRSEGFGRCLAEAMLLGKPVIATDYSGSREFAREGTVSLVNYQLVPVGEGAYPFWQGQTWADPDVEHAAAHMRRLFADSFYRREMGRAGQSFINDNFNEVVIGARYAKRLEEINRTRVGWKQPVSANGASVPASLNDQIVGCIDLPSVDGATSFYDPGVPIEGWAASKAGIEAIEVYCNDVVHGQAHHGVLRSDIAQNHPEMVDPGRSGYCFLLDASNLQPGSHTITVKAKSRSGKKAEWQREFTLSDSGELYREWLAHNTPIGRDSAECAFLDREFSGRALLSLILVVTSTDGRLFDLGRVRRTLESISTQLYRNFEIIAAVDEPIPGEIHSLMRQIDPLERLRFRIVEGDWFSAIAACRGEFIGLLDAGDILDDRAVLAVARNISTNQSVHFIYADEDRALDGHRLEPRFKPAWSPLYFETYNYVGRPWFASRKLVKAAAPKVRKDGHAQEYEFLRHVTSSCRTLCHIPMVLASRASGDSSEAGVSGFAVASDSRPEVRWPRVSVIIPTRLGDERIVENCFKGLLDKTDYPDLEVIVVANNLPDRRRASDWLKRWPFKVLHWDAPYNWSAINNFGARHASGEFFLFLNDDIEPLDQGWLKSMVSLAQREFVGAVGAFLLYPNGRIQHAGIYTVDYGGGARHMFRFLSGNEKQTSWLVPYNREQSAVTGACLLSRRDCFDAVKGFDENMPVVCNDADYCLRLSERGFSSVVVSSARLVHHEAISRAGIDEREDVKTFWQRWKDRLASCDPFTNPNIDSSRDDWSVSSTARGSLLGRFSVNRFLEEARE